MLYKMLYYVTDMNHLIKRLKSYRLENRLTQQSLAKKLNVTFATVNRWFNGKSEPNEIQSYHIEKLLKIKQQKSKNNNF